MKNFSDWTYTVNHAQWPSCDRVLKWFQMNGSQMMYFHWERGVSSHGGKGFVSWRAGLFPWREGFCLTESRPVPQGSES